MHLYIESIAAFVKSGKLVRAVETKIGKLE